MSEDQSTSSLFQDYPKRWDIPLIVVLSLGLNITALALPFMVMTKAIFFEDEYSLLHSVELMWTNGFYLLAAVVFLFSVIFPFFKLGAMGVCWFKPMSAAGRAKFLGIIGWLGKWSMLDVFIIATLLTMTQAKALLDAEPRAGLYLFAAAILLSMTASVLIDKVAKRSKDETG